MQKDNNNQLSAHEHTEAEFLQSSKAAFEDET